MKKAKSNIIIFGIGAIGYGLIEIIWRRKTHWSMLLAGGLSLLGLSKISVFLKKACLFKKALAGCALITAIEYIFGIIFNVVLKRKVWDYSRMPLNFRGQICALYSFYWLILSIIFIPIADKIQNKLR